MILKSRCLPRICAGRSSHYSTRRHTFPLHKSPVISTRLPVLRLLSVSLDSLNNKGDSSPLFGPSRLDHSMAGSPKSIYDFTVKDAKGNEVSLGDYKGKVLLIVNVASQCGLTNSNYKGLSDLYTNYKGKGLEILAFPCNQFRNQEPGTNEEIAEFACTRFKVEFPIFDKVDVNGKNESPLFTFLKEMKGGLFGDGIKWNFTKFLVDKNGNIVDRYAPTTPPSKIEKDIKKCLEAQ